MKTAISIPEHLFEKAEVLRKRLKLSRSQLYARAVEQFLTENAEPDIETMTDAEITAALDASYERHPQPLDPVLASLQRASLEEDW